MDDESIFADNVRIYLERTAYSARVANDGASAIELAPEFSPDVILMDYRLPDMTGFDAFDEITKSCVLPCILTTAHPSEEVYRGAAERGIRNLLFKPFPLSELATLLFVLRARMSA